MNKLIDLTGSKFGKLTVIEKAHTKNSKVYWICKCNCGKMKVVRGSSLKSGDSQSCGDAFCKGKINDLTGQRFGKLFVVSYCGIKNKRAYFNCKCDCGNYKEIEGNKLTSGKNTTCTECKTNKYYKENDYMVGLTKKGEKFFFDVNDYDLIKSYNWFMMQGYMHSKSNNKVIKMHRLILDVPEDKIVDHIDGNRSNNRRNNIRICTQRENCFNRTVRNDSLTQAKGIRIKSNGTYQVRIQKDGKRYNLGTYDSLEEAKKVYNKNAIIIHGEHAKLTNNIKEQMD